MKIKYYKELKITIKRYVATYINISSIILT